MFWNIVLGVLIFLCVFLTYLLYSKEQFELAIEMLTVLTNKFMCGDIDELTYNNSKEKIIGNFNRVQKQWYKWLKN